MISSRTSAMRGASAPVIFAAASSTFSSAFTSLRSEAVELMPASRDALIGPYFAVGLARTYMMVGEPDRAVETLAPLLEIPSPITRAGLGADPLWAPLQKHPVFQKLIAEVKQPAE